MKNLPLEGIRVVELGSSLAAPFAALILSQLGAEVFKVESPDGDVMRRWGAAEVGGTSAAFETFNRGKRSLSVDFNDPAAVDGLRKFIAAGAHAVLQNLRPGAVERFGLGAERLRADSPGLVYCNLGAFGEHGPLRELPGYDPLMQAFSGIIATTGERDRDPVRVGVSMIDMSTGMWGAIGILALLVRRMNTGTGGVVDGSLFESSLTWLSMNFGTLQVEGALPERGGLQGPLISPNGGFHTQDGIIMVVVGTDDQFVRMCGALGLDGLADDPRFATTNARVTNKADLRVAMETQLASATRAHWVARLNDANVPCAPLQDLKEAAAHAQTEAMGMVQTRPDGAFSVLGFPLRVDGARPPYEHRAPTLGEHNSVLASREDSDA